MKILRRVGALAAVGAAAALIALGPAAATVSATGALSYRLDQFAGGRVPPPPQPVGVHVNTG